MARDRRILLFAFSAFIALASVSLMISYYGGASGARASSYALLEFGSDSDDRAIVAALSARGLPDVVSESTEWVLLDDFGFQERVPLDQYDSRLESFDPRNDGYADRLKASFVSGGKRRVYVKEPISTAIFGGRRAFDAKLRAALDGYAFTVSYDEPAALSVPSIVLFVAAFGGFVFLSKRRVRSLLAFPPVAAFIRFGPVGFVSAGFLVAAYLSSFPLLEEILDPRSFFLKKTGGSRANMDTEVIRKKWGLDTLPSVASFTALSLLFASSGIAETVIWFFSLAAMIAEGYFCLLWDSRMSLFSGHVRFSPIRLTPSRREEFMRVGLLSAPFALASGIVLMISLFSSAGAGTESFAAPTVSAADYSAHLAAQNSFLSVNLHKERLDGPYRDYRFGADGLLEEGGEVSLVSAAKVELPPAEQFFFFPAGTASRLLSGPGGLFRTILALTLSLAISALSLVGLEMLGKRRGESAESAEKRIAA